MIDLEGHSLQDITGVKILDITLISKELDSYRPDHVAQLAGHWARFSLWPDMIQHAHYGTDSRPVHIHAKKFIPVSENTFCQVTPVDKNTFCSVSYGGLLSRLPVKVSRCDVDFMKCKQKVLFPSGKVVLV